MIQDFKDPPPSEMKAKVDVPYCWGYSCYQYSQVRISFVKYSSFCYPDPVHSWVLYLVVFSSILSMDPSCITRDRRSQRVWSSLMYHLNILIFLLCHGFITLLTFKNIKVMFKKVKIVGSVLHTDTLDRRECGGHERAHLRCQSDIIYI